MRSLQNSSANLPIPVVGLVGNYSTRIGPAISVRTFQAAVHTIHCYRMQSNRGRVFQGPCTTSLSREAKRMSRLS